MERTPNLSIFKGKQRPFHPPGDSFILSAILEKTLDTLEKLNNGEEASSFHEIKIEPGNPVIYFKDEVTPVAQMNEEANQLARAILAYFPGRTNSEGDTTIMLDIPRSQQLVTAMFAAWKIGASVINVDKKFPDGRIHQILEGCQPGLVITLEENSTRYNDYPTVIYEILKKMSAPMPTANLPRETSWGAFVPEYDRLIIIVYTSGSTGIPKGVRISHRNLLTRMQWQFHNHPYSNTEKVCLFKTNPTFLDWSHELLCPLVGGRSVLILSNSQITDIADFIKACEKYKIERITMVPTFLQSFLTYIERQNKLKKEQIQRMPDLKLCYSTSETLLVPLAQKFHRAFPEDRVTLINFFGSTESVSDILYYTMRGVDKMLETDKIPLGQVFDMFDNVVIYILDNDFRPVLHGEGGEICASGPMISQGYVGKRDPHKYVDNPFTTDPAHSKIYCFGDYGRYVNGFIYHEGRIDSLIKIRGHRVELAEIEAAISKVRDIESTCVLSYKPGQAEQAIIAFVTTNNPTLDASIVEEEIGNVLLPYMIPQVLIVPEIPVLTSNKVDRQKLMKYYEAETKTAAAGSESLFDYSEIPLSDQKKAEALFKTVALTLENRFMGKLSGKSNYFKIGGNSLNTMLTVAKLTDIGYIISIQEFIAAKSMKDIISCMKESDKGKDVSLLNLATVPEGKYITKIVKPEHKKDVIRILTNAFTDPEKSDLERYFTETEIHRLDYQKIIDCLWDVILRDKISFVIKNSTGNIVAACITLDYFTCPSLENIKLTGKATKTIIEFVHYLEAQFSETEIFKNSKKIAYAFMAATADNIAPSENVQLFCYIEQEVVKIARDMGYNAIFGINVSPLAQQLAIDVFQYKVLKDYQINKYTAPDGTKPFAAAPNSARTITAWKPL